MDLAAVWKALRAVAIADAITNLESFPAGTTHSQEQKQHWRFIEKRTGAVTATGFPIRESGFFYNLGIDLKTATDPYKIVVEVKPEVFLADEVSGGTVSAGSAGPFRSPIK